MPPTTHRRRCARWSALALTFATLGLAQAQDAFRLVADLTPGTEGSACLAPPVVVENQWYALLQSPGDPVIRLWTSDGTASGTKPVYSPTHRVVRRLFPTGNHVLFLAERNAEGRLVQDLWRCGDGGAQLERWSTMPGIARASEVAACRGRLIQVHYDSSQGLSQWDVWFHDRAGAHPLFTSREWVGSPLATESAVFVALNSLESSRLIAIDPASDKSTTVLDLPHPVEPSLRIRLESSTTTHVFFRVSTDHESALWVSDGSTQGTREIGTVHMPRGAVALDGRWLFSGFAEDTGFELWTSDGTREGTHLMADLWRGGISSDPLPMVRVGDGIFFTAVTPLDGQPYSNDLWRSDGSSNGTLMVKRFASQFGPDFEETSMAAVNDRLFFRVSTEQHGSELWASDGSDSGTRRLGDVNPGTASFRPDHLTAVGSRLFLFGDDGVHGRELWVYDPAVDAANQPPSRHASASMPASSAGGGCGAGSGIAAWTCGLALLMVVRLRR